MPMPFKQTKILIKRERNVNTMENNLKEAT